MSTVNVHSIVAESEETLLKISIRLLSVLFISLHKDGISRPLAQGPDQFSHLFSFVQPFKHFCINFCSFLAQGNDLLDQRERCNYHPIDVGNYDISRVYPEIPLKLKWHIDLGRSGEGV